MVKPASTIWWVIAGLVSINFWWMKLPGRLTLAECVSCFEVVDGEVNTTKPWTLFQWRSCLYNLYIVKTMPLLYPPLQRSWKGGILVSPCPSLRLSICGQNRVHSVSSTILIGSISHLHILSSNFRRCAACNTRFKIQKFLNFLNL